VKIVADENIPLINEVFAGLGDVRTYAGRSITADQVKDADVLLVRSVTRVDKTLLAGSQVKFVGTCTIGTDHIDLTYLKDHNIAFSAAPGCNANAVVDYVLSVLVVLARQQCFDLASRCVGIVGVGNVGSRLKARLEAIGMRCVCADPLHDDQNIPGLVHLDELIEQADIISLHTPLTKTGSHPTYHLFSRDSLLKLKAGSILINSSRGSVVDNAALMKVLEERSDITAVLDVWEGEPEVSLPLLSKVTLATPHIAGYSLDGKIHGTRMVYEALCRTFQLDESIDVCALAPTVNKLDGTALDDQNAMLAAFDLVLKCYDVRRDDRAFRQVMVAENNDLAGSFDELRKNYPERRELGVTGILLNGSQKKLKSLLSDFGFKC